MSIYKWLKWWRLCHIYFHTRSWRNCFVSCYIPISQHQQLSLRISLEFGIFFFIYNFIYLWLLWVFIRLFSSCGELGLLFSCVALASQCSGFLFQNTALGHTGFSKCGASVSLLLSTWGPPISGIRPVPPALAGGFFTTESPGKPWNLLRIIIHPFDRWGPCSYEWSRVRGGTMNGLCLPLLTP